MKKDNSIVGILSSLTLITTFLVSPQSQGGNVIFTHIYWAELALMAVLSLAAALFTFQATFKTPKLGGIIGTSLKFFSVGLFCISIAAFQMLVMNLFNLYKSNYFSSGIYWIPLFIGIIFMGGSLLITAKEYASKVVVYIFAVVLEVIIMRLALIFSPQSTELLQTKADLSRALTINSILVGSFTFLLILSILLRNSFRSSKVGNIFLIFVGAFACLLLGMVTGFYVIFSGRLTIFYESGAYFIPLVGSIVLFYIFSIRLKYLKI